MRGRESLHAVIAQQLTAPREESEILKTIQSLTLDRRRLASRSSSNMRKVLFRPGRWCGRSTPPRSKSISKRNCSAAISAVLPPCRSKIFSWLAAAPAAIRSTSRAHFPTQMFLPSISVVRVLVTRSEKRVRCDISNVEYAHADILRLGSIGREFDLIEFDRRLASSQRSGCRRASPVVVAEAERDHRSRALQRTRAARDCRGTRSTSRKKGIVRRSRIFAPAGRI